jgi:thymidylate synthase ThyX
MTTAKIIADSISEAGIRITTMELTYERFIHSQFMTHRMFSRNAQSSRAIPTAKQIELIRDLSAPHFLKNKAGMQASEEFKDWEHDYAVKYWNQARDYAIAQAEVMLDLGVHKQWANRILEPFSTIKVVVTATEWQNFFDLRLHHDAQPEIQELAQTMKAAIDESEPALLRVGEWHLPYITDDDKHYHGTDGAIYEDWQKELPKISAARCARVSYLNHDNSNPDIEKDLELARNLLESGHLSPFEHQSKPIDNHYSHRAKGITHVAMNDGAVWSGNFRGWTQHRALV